MPLLVPVVVFVLFLVHCSLFRGLSSGVASWMAGLLLVLLRWLRMGILFGLLRGCSVSGGLDAVRISEVKGHADEALVRAGGARDLDRLGDNGADEAADFGRGRVPWWIVDARRNYSGVCARWRPVVLDLHRFFIAIARAVVNHDGGAGTSVDPTVWSVGGAPERCRVVHAVRDRAFLPGPAGIWDGGWVVVAATPITCHDVELWPYCVSMLVKWVAFLATLHWPQGGVDLGVGSVSFVEMLILYELWGWIWRRLFPSTIGQVAQFQCRLFLLVQTLIFCDLAGMLVRYFVLLLHCLGVFVGSSLVILVPITAGFGTLGGRSVFMALLPGLVSRLQKIF